MLIVTDEIYEHEPVHSTDRLEKPRHINPPQASARPGYASCTLPRKRMNFNGASPGIQFWVEQVIYG